MKKLNKKLIAGTAMVATAAALAACGTNATVYGPPDVTEPEVTIEDISTEPEEDVYGPPSWFGESEETSEFDPGTEVYGPPADVTDPDDDEKQTPEPPVYGPPEDEGLPVQP